MAIREQAAKIPGYGQPDIFYPPYFQGSWQVERTLVGFIEGGTETVSTEDAAIIRSIMEEAEALQNKPVAFKARFFFHRRRFVAPLEGGCGLSSEEVHLNKAVLLFVRDFDGFLVLNA